MCRYYPIPAMPSAAGQSRAVPPWLWPAFRLDYLPSFANLRHTIELLGRERLAYLSGLPLGFNLDATNFGETLAVHASPISQFLGFKPEDLHELVSERMRSQDNCTLIVGHTHVQFLRQWSKSLIVNVGSVGMPLDGSPLADFAIATLENGSFTFEFRQVEYDRRLFMAQLKSSGFWEIGGDIVKVFAYQTMTGLHVVEQYLASWAAYARQTNASISDVYSDISLPLAVESYFLGCDGV